MDLLQPGDVILVRSRGLLSTIIAASSPLCKYSHSIIVVRPNLWLEVRVDGVGYTVRRADCTEGGDAPHILCDVSQYRRICVLRHPALTGLGQDPALEAQTLSTLQRCALEVMGCDYPAWDVLLETTGFRREARGVLKPCMRVAERIFAIWDKEARKVPSRVAPGPFCSELAAVAYQSLGLPLFNSARRPAATAPNDLADTAQCLLRPVADVFAESARPAPNDAELLRYANRLPSALGEGNRIVFPLPRLRRLTGGTLTGGAQRQEAQALLSGYASRWDDLTVKIDDASLSDLKLV
jgi:hypothetical protein